MTVTFDFGTLDLEVDTGPHPVTGSASFAFGGLSLTVTSRRPSAALYDENNVWVCNLPLAKDIQWGRELSDTGYVSLALPLDDETTALATAKRFLKVLWRGRVQQAARIDSSSIALAVDGRKWRVFDNLPGCLNMLGDLVVWPEYGVDRTASTTRTYGYMSATNNSDGDSGWFGSGNWTGADGVRYREDTGFRQAQPAGLSFPNPAWIAKRGPYHIEPAGSIQWFHHQFHTYSDEITYQILATGDDVLELWLDAEQIITPETPQAQAWKQLMQVTGRLQAGLHVIAGRVRNGRRKAGAVAGICAMQQLKANGDVVDGPPIAWSSPRWKVSDVLPGFRGGDVLRRTVFENRAHDIATADLIGMGFNHVSDTDGEQWGDEPDQHEFDTGGSGLDLAQQLAEKLVDVGMDPDALQLLAWNRKGSDKSATVRISRGHLRPSSEAPGSSEASALSVQLEQREAQYNVLLIQLADGTWIEETDAASIATYGRVVSSVSAGSTSTERKAASVADGLFTENAHPSRTFTVQISSGVGPQPDRDFVEGDSIGVEDEAGDWVKVRVMGIRVDATSDRITNLPIDVEVVVDES